MELFLPSADSSCPCPLRGQILAGSERVSLRDYYWRRLTRIEPPYVISLLHSPFCCARWCSGGCRTLSRMYGDAGWLHYSLAHIGASTGVCERVLFSALIHIRTMSCWSLEVEVQFYLLAPWLVKIFLCAKNVVAARAHLPEPPRCFLISQVGLVGNPIGRHFRCWEISRIFLTGFFAGGFLSVGRIGGAGFQMGRNVFYSSARQSFLSGTAAAGQLFERPVAAFRGKITARFLGNRWIATIEVECATPFICIIGS